MGQELGDVIREARDRVGCSQSELARRIGVSSGFMTKVEKNQALPSYECLFSIANALGLDHEQLFALAEEAKAKRTAIRIRAKGETVRHVYGQKSQRQKDSTADTEREEEVVTVEDLAHAVWADADLRRAVLCVRIALDDPDLKEADLKILEMFARQAKS